MEQDRDSKRPSRENITHATMVGVVVGVLLGPLLVGNIGIGIALGIAIAVAFSYTPDYVGAGPSSYRPGSLSGGYWPVRPSMHPRSRSACPQ